jgi:hypothetical protein
VEEAAEILEAHVVMVLSPYTEHLVLIGDHQQLRPKVRTIVVSGLFCKQCCHFDTV